MNDHATRRLRTPAGRFGWLLVLLVVVMPTASAWAADTDLVVLKNGNRLAGEVKGLRQGKLELHTNSFGTVYIKWDRVVEIVAPRYFEVETADGARYYGSLQPAGPGRVGVALDPDVQELVLESVVGIRPILQSYWARLDGAISLGASYTQSSGIGQGTLNANVASRRPRYEMTSALSLSLTVQDGLPDSSRGSLSLTYSRFLANRWFASGLGKLDSNEDLGFKLRSSAGALAGRYLVRSNRSTLAAGAGLFVNEEIPIEGERTSNVEASFGINYSFFTYDTPKTSITFVFDLFPSLTDGGRVRADVNTTVSREFFKDFTVGVTAYNNYDNRPPTEGANKNDIGFSLSIGWSF